MISTIVEGLLGGLVHSYMIKRGRPDKVFSPLTAGAITFVAEMAQMAIILLIARPFEDALHLVSSIAAPMMVTNTVGAALFMRILLDKRAMFEKYTSAFSATALKVAASTEGILRRVQRREQHEGGPGALQGAGYRRGGDNRSGKAAGLYRYGRRSPSAGQTDLLSLYAARHRNRRGGVCRR